MAAPEFPNISHSFLPPWYVGTLGSPNPENHFFIAGCDGRAIGYDFMGRKYRQSILTAMNLFLHVELMY